MSSANLGLAHNIIGVTRNRNTENEYCQIMINPKVVEYSDEEVESYSNCGSLTLPEPIAIRRPANVLVNGMTKMV